MTFRIIRYYDRFRAQVRKSQSVPTKDEWQNIGLPNGYATIDEARNCCKVYKETSDYKVVEVFDI